MRFDPETLLAPPRATRDPVITSSKIASARVCLAQRDDQREKSLRRRETSPILPATARRSRRRFAFPRVGKQRFQPLRDRLYVTVAVPSAATMPSGTPAESGFPNVAAPLAGLYEQRVRVAVIGAVDFTITLRPVKPRATR